MKTYQVILAVALTALTAGTVHAAARAVCANTGPYSQHNAYRERVCVAAAFTRAVAAVPAPAIQVTRSARP